MSPVGLLALATLLEGAAQYAPKLDPAPEVLPSEVKYVETKRAETILRGAPWVPFKRLATLDRGTRLVVRGWLKSRDKKSCEGRSWYAVHPFGYVCSSDVVEAKAAPEAGLAIAPAPGKRVPFDYVFVRTEDAPAYASIDDARAGTVERTLEKGMSLVVARIEDGEDGRRFVVASDGRYVAEDDVRFAGQGSKWAGVWLRDTGHRGPAFAWTVGDKTHVRATPSATGTVVETLPKRSRVPLLERSVDGDSTWWRVGEGRWISADVLAEVVIQKPPRGVLGPSRDDDEAADAKKHGDHRWIDVDVGEQVLVAYRGETPMYATLVSSGTGSKTPLGNYPIWAKVASVDMNNQDYEDNAYLVQGVPWVLFFQGHNALHGAYWHDGFGRKKSHGCVNLAPLDARFVFEWALPEMARGWTGLLPASLDESVIVHVRDSSRPEGQQFTQERRIGPPDREEEQRKLEAALARREAAGEGSFPMPPSTDEGATDGSAPPARRLEPPPLPNAPL